MDQSSGVEEEGEDGRRRRGCWQPDSRSTRQTDISLTDDPGEMGIVARTVFRRHPV